MSAATKVVGYPAHAVWRFAQWENQHRAKFTSWAARCGASGTESGHAPFGLAGSARRKELCRTCFPGQDWNACWTGEPERVSDRKYVHIGEPES